MKNWKTTILGALIGGLIAVQPLITGGETDVKQILIGFLIAAFGVVSKDFNVSGGQK